MDKTVEAILKKIGVIKKDYSKYQTKLFKQSKTEKDKSLKHLAELGVDTFRIRLEELNKVEKMIKEEVK